MMHVRKTLCGLLLQLLTINTPCYIYTNVLCLCLCVCVCVDQELMHAACMRGTSVCLWWYCLLCSPGGCSRLRVPRITDRLQVALPSCRWARHIRMRCWWCGDREVERSLDTTVLTGNSAHWFSAQVSQSLDFLTILPWFLSCLTRRSVPLGWHAISVWAVLPISCCSVAQTLWNTLLTTRRIGLLSHRDDRRKWACGFYSHPWSKREENKGGKYTETIIFEVECRTPSHPTAVLILKLVSKLITRSTHFRIHRKSHTSVTTSRSTQLENDREDIQV